MTLVDDVKRKLHRPQRGTAPIFLGVLARMGMLEGKPVGACCVEGDALCLGQPGIEMGVAPGNGGGGPVAPDQGHRVCHQIVRSATSAFVGVSHRTTALQAPFAGGNATIHAARTGGCGGHDARAGCVEVAGHLHHQGHVLATRAIVRVGQVLGAGNLAVSAKLCASLGHRGAIQAAEATCGGRVHDGAVVGVDGPAAQFGHRGAQRISIGWHNCGGQPGGTQTSSEQIVAVAVVRRFHHRAQIGRFLVDVIAATATRRQSGCSHNCQTHRLHLVSHTCLLFKKVSTHHTSTTRRRSPQPPHHTSGKVVDRQHEQHTQPQQPAVGRQQR